MDEQKPKTEGRLNFMLGFFAGLALISAIGFFVLLGIMFTGREQVSLGNNTNEPTVNEPTNNNTAQPTAKPVRAIDKNDNYKGNLNAKVQFIIYDDFECPFCLRHEDTVKKILADYGDKIVLAMRHFPLSFHAQAEKAAEASECAAEQGKFWEMSDKLFADNAAGTMGVDQFIKDAGALGLNVNQFTSCLNGGKYAAKIQASITEGESFGVNGTPGNFINGQLLSGALPYEQFKTVIDAALAK